MLSYDDYGEPFFTGYAENKIDMLHVEIKKLHQELLNLYMQREHDWWLQEQLESCNELLETITKMKTL